MPDWHFYLLRHHILSYIKFLFFCFLAPDEIRILPKKNKGIVPKSVIFIQMQISSLNVNPLKFNFPESHILLIHSMLLNYGFRLDRKKKKYHIPDAASERV